MPESHPINTSYTTNREPTAQNRFTGERHVASLIAERIAERHPDWPPIKLEFYFSFHVTPQDKPGLKKKLAGCNIFLYENPTGDRLTQDYQAVADLDASQFSANHISYLINTKYIWAKGNDREADLRALYGSKKIVGRVDLLAGDPVTFFDIGNASAAISNIRSGDFEQILQQYKENVTHLANLQIQREELMFERFESEIAKLIQAHPELKSNQEVNILWALGAIHTTLFHNFRQAGLDTMRAFSYNPYVYRHLSELQRVITFGLEPSRDLLAKVYIENEFRKVLITSISPDVWPDTYEREFYLRQIASVFSTEEIKDIHDQIVATGELTSNMVNQRLEAKGLDRLPENASQLHAILERQGKK